VKRRARQWLGVRLQDSLSGCGQPQRASIVSAVASQLSGVEVQALGRSSGCGAPNVSEVESMFNSCAGVVQFRPVLHVLRFRIGMYACGVGLGYSAGHIYAETRSSRTPAESS
jgi:hypothetical protein